MKSAARGLLPQQNQIFCIAIRERAQECVVHHREHGGCGGDAEREGADDGCGEGRRAADLAQSVAKVLTDAFQPLPTPGGAGYVFDQRNAAKLAHGSGSRCIGFHAAGHVVLYRHAKVRLKLFVQLALAVSEQAGQEAHALSPSGSRSMIEETAWTIRCQRPRSEASCFFPEAVMR